MPLFCITLSSRFDSQQRITFKGTTKWKRPSVRTELESKRIHSKTPQDSSCAVCTSPKHSTRMWEQSNDITTSHLSPKSYIMGFIPIFIVVKRRQGHWLICQTPKVCVRRMIDDSEIRGLKGRPADAAWSCNLSEILFVQRKTKLGGCWGFSFHLTLMN